MGRRLNKYEVMEDKIGETLREAQSGSESVQTKNRKYFKDIENLERKKAEEHHLNQ